MSYKKALRKLEKLPIGERQLAAGQYVWEVKKGKSHCGCAIGKLLTERQRVKLFNFRDVAGGIVNETGVDGLRLSFLGVDTDSEDSGVLDLTRGEAYALQAENDGFPTCAAHGTRNSYASRKARYKHVVAWLREQVASGASPEAEFGSVPF